MSHDIGVVTIFTFLETKLGLELILRCRVVLGLRLELGRWIGLGLGFLV